MDSLYSVVVRLGMDSAGFAAGASLATTLLQKIEAQAATAGTSVAALHRSIGLLGAGVAITGVGFLLGDALLHAAKKGAELQVVMAGIGLATGATHAQMLALESSFTTIGLKNQMSKTDAAHIALAATHAGITDTRQLQATIPTLANFAEVQNLSTGASRETAATTGAEYAHLFGAYSSQLLVPLVNDLSKALTHTPLSAAGFLRLTSQFAGQTASVYGTTTPEQLRMQRDDTMMGVLLGQMGQGSRGGTQFGSSITRMATAKEGGAIDRAIDFLEKAGKGQFFDAGGRFLGDRNMLAILQRDRAALPLDVLAAANKEAFGAVGMKLMGNLELPARLQQWDTNATTFARIPGIDQQQQVYNATAAGQSQQWHKNIETAVTLFGTALLPTLVKVSQAFVGITRTVVEFMSTHKDIVAFAAGFGLVATGAALIVGPILTMVGAVGLLTIGFGALDIAILPFTLIVLGIAAVIGGVVLLITHWTQVTGALGTMVSGVGAQIGAFLGIAGALAGVFGQIIGAIAQATGLDKFLSVTMQCVSAWARFADTTLHIGDMLRANIGLIDQFLHWVGILHNPPTPGGTTVTVPASASTSAAATTFTTPQRDKHGHVITDKHGHALTTTQQAVRATRADSGTVGLPTTIRVAPITSAPPPHPAVTRHTSTTTAHHTSTAHHSAAVQNHHTAHHTATTTARGGDTHIHVHPGAAAIHVHPGPGHDHKKIADETAKAAGDHLGHHIANALRTSGVLPSTTRPTLHQIGMN